MQYYIDIAGKKLPVVVTRKSMKKVRLKVFPSGEVLLSIPLDTPDQWITDFLNSKQKWVATKLAGFDRTKAIEKEEHIRSGASTRILGKQMIVYVVAANQKKVVITDKQVSIFTTNPEEQVDIDKQFNNWWQKSSKQYFTEVVDKLYPIIQKHGIDKPKITVKKMSTLWGSCSRKNKQVNLNFYLYKAPRPCVEYVILHEMTHFLYPNHNKEFFDFLTIYMPDWQERKKKLDYEVVLGV